MTDGFCIIHSDPNLLPSPRVDSISHKHFGNREKKAPRVVNFAMVYKLTLSSSFSMAYM